MGNGDAGETIGSRLYRDEQQLWKVKATPFPVTDVRECTCVGDGAGGEHGGKQQLFLPALQGPPFSPSTAGSWNGTQGMKGTNYPLAYSLAPLLEFSG